MYLKGVYKQNLAIFMCFLVISLSFASARSFAQPVSPPADYAVEIVHISGENGVNGFAKPGDEISVVAKIKTNEMPETYQVLFNGYPADSCKLKEDNPNYYFCKRDGMDTIPPVSVAYNNKAGLTIVLASKSVVMDDVSPEFAEFAWDESKRQLNFKVSDSSRVPGDCSGIKDLVLNFKGVELGIDPTIKTKTLCSISGYFNLAAHPGEHTGDVKISAIDNLDNFKDSQTQQIVVDNQGPVLQSFTLSTGTESGGSSYVNPSHSYSVVASVTMKDVAFVGSNYGDSKADAYDFVKDVIPDDEANKFKSLDPNSCSFVNENTINCKWSFPSVITTSSTRSINVIAGDGKGNYASYDNSVEYEEDSKKPSVLNLTSNYPFVDRNILRNYVGKSDNVFKAIFRELGSGLAGANVFLDMSSISLGRTKVKAKSCNLLNDAEATWGCEWDPISVNKKNIESGDFASIKLHSSFDDAFNLMNDKVIKVIFDDTPPNIMKIEHEINSFHDCPTSSDVITFNVLVKDTSPVTRIEINGALDEESRVVDTNDVFGGSCERYKLTEDLHVCSVNLSRFISFSKLTGKILLTVYDAAGNYDSQEKPITVCASNRTGVPNCVFLSKGMVLPKIVDWRASSVKPFPLYVQLIPGTLSSTCTIYETVLDATQPIHSTLHSGILPDVEKHTSKSACAFSEFPVVDSEILNAKQKSPLLSLRLGGRGSEAINVHNRSACVNKTDSGLDCYNPIKPVIECKVGFVVRDGLTYYEKIETEHIKFVAPLANLPIEAFDASYNDLIEGIKKDLRDTDSKIDQILIWAEYIRWGCEYLQYAILMTTIVTILTTTASIIFSPIIKACPETSTCAFIGTGLSKLLTLFTDITSLALEASSYFWNYLPISVDDLYQLPGWLLRATCLINTCHLCSIGDGSGASKPEGFFKAMGVMASLVAGLQMAGADTAANSDYEGSGEQATDAIAAIEDGGSSLGTATDAEISAALDQVTNTYFSSNMLVNSLITNSVSSAIQGAIETSDAYAGTNIEPGFNAALGTAALTGGAGVAAGAGAGAVAGAGVAGTTTGLAAGGLSLDDDLEMNPYKSKEVAESCFCYPGQLAAERKRKQILCKEYKCVKDMAQYGTLPVNVCTEMRAVRECLYYHGAIVEIGLPMVWLIIQTIVAGALKLLFPPSFLVSRVLQWLTQQIMDLPAVKATLGSAMTDWITVPSYNNYAEYAAMLMYDYGELSTPMEGSNYMGDIMSTMDDSCGGVEYND
jgi:hypothetical protein